VYYPEDESAMSSDARNWYKKGIDNSNQDLYNFSDLLAKLEAGQNVNAALKKQVSAYFDQVNEANENTKNVVPKLGKLVQYLADWSKNPGFFDTIKIKTTLYFVDGKRDNKSYYLLNGSGRWAKIRADSATSTNPAVAKLAQDLNGFKTDSFKARDEFDDAAQIFVKSLAKLVELKSGLPKNAPEFHAVATDLSAQLKAHAPLILEAGQKAVDNAKAYIATF